LKRRPVPRKKKNSRPEPDPKNKQRGMLEKKTKKYGVVNVILEEDIEEFVEGPEV
jgi:hypothetical protein